MRIVQATSSIEYGGAERRAVELANELATRHDVFFIAPEEANRDSPNNMSAQLSTNVERVYFRSFPFTTSSLMMALHKIDADIADCHSPRVARLMSLLPNRPPCVATLHTWYRREYRRCDGILCVAAWQADSLRDQRGVSATVYNWCLPGGTVDAHDRKELRASLGADDATVVIISVGRLHRQKRHDVMIDAVSEMNALGRDLQLWIVGDGHDEQMLRRMSGPNVRIVGFRDDVPRLLRAADLYASSADYEACPLVLLEAMDAGLPLVLSDIPAHREIAGAKALAFVRRDDPCALALCLKKAIDGGLCPQAYDMSGFRIETQVPKIEAFYEKAVVSRKQRRVF